MEERYKCSIVVDLMLTRENSGEKEVLLALRQNTGYNDGKYELPGGHVDANEDLIDAMIREAKEELNIDLNRKYLKIEHVLHHFKGNRIKFVILAEKYEGNLKIGEPDQCSNLEWFNINELPSNIDEKVVKVLKEIKYGIFYDNSNFVNLTKR